MTLFWQVDSREWILKGGAFWMKDGFLEIKLPTVMFRALGQVAFFVNIIEAYIDEEWIYTILHVRLELEGYLCVLYKLKCKKSFCQDNVDSVFWRTASIASHYFTLSYHRIILIVDFCESLFASHIITCHVVTHAAQSSHHIVFGQVISWLLACKWNYCWAQLYRNVVAVSFIFFVTLLRRCISSPCQWHDVSSHRSVITVVCCMAIVVIMVIMIQSHLDFFPACHV